MKRQVRIQLDHNQMNYLNTERAKEGKSLSAIINEILNAHSSQGEQNGEITST